MSDRNAFTQEPAGGFIDQLQDRAFASERHFYPGTAHAEEPESIPETEPDETLVVPLDNAPLEVSRLTTWTIDPEVERAFALAAGLGQSDETTAP